jgi:hypothetical protein
LTEFEIWMPRLSRLQVASEKQDSPILTVVFGRTRIMRCVTITKTNRPKTEASSHLSMIAIESCYDETTCRRKSSVIYNSNASKGLTLMTQMTLDQHVLCVRHPGVDVQTRCNSLFTVNVPGPPSFCTPTPRIRVYERLKNPKMTPP